VSGATRSTLWPVAFALAFALAVAAHGEDPASPPYPGLSWADALEQAEHDGDFTRILAEGPPELWDSAARSLIGEKDWVSPYALPVLLQRLDALGPDAHFRVAAALVQKSNDPRVLPLLGRLAYEPHREGDPRLRAMATERMEEPGIRTAYERWERGEEPYPKTRPAPPPPTESSSEARSTPIADGRSWLYLGLLLISGWLGFVIFLWGLRLLRLLRLVPRHAAMEYSRCGEGLVGGAD